MRAKSLFKNRCGLSGTYVPTNSAQNPDLLFTTLPTFTVLKFGFQQHIGNICIPISSINYNEKKEYFFIQVVRLKTKSLTNFKKQNWMIVING